MTLVEKVLKILDLTSVETLENKAKSIGAKLEWKGDDEVRITHEVFNITKDCSSRNEALNNLMNLTVQYLLNEKLQALSDEECDKVVSYLTGKPNHPNSADSYNRLSERNKVLPCYVCERDIDTLCEVAHVNKYTGTYPLCSEVCVVEDILKTVLE